MTDSFPPNCYEWLAKQSNEKINYKELSPGDVIAYVFDHDVVPDTEVPKPIYYLIKELSIDKVGTFSWINRDNKIGQSTFDIGMRYEWPRLQVDWSMFESADNKNRKDYCHHCQNDRLTWRNMAAYCNECNRMILG